MDNTFQGFLNSVKGLGESEILLGGGGGGGGGGIFLLVGGNPRRSDFDHSNLFQSYKQVSVNTEYRLKSKLAWSLCTRSMKLK